MFYALTQRLPLGQRNEIAREIERAVQQRMPDALRGRPIVIYASDAVPSQEYFCVYCERGRVHLQGRNSGNYTVTERRPKSKLRLRRKRDKITSTQDAIHTTKEPSYYARS